MVRGSVRPVRSVRYTSRRRKRARQPPAGNLRRQQRGSYARRIRDRRVDSARVPFEVLAPPRGPLHRGARDRSTLSPSTLSMRCPIGAWDGISGGCDC